MSRQLMTALVPRTTALSAQAGTFKQCSTGQPQRHEGHRQVQDAAAVLSLVCTAAATSAMY